MSPPSQGDLESPALPFPARCWEPRWVEALLYPRCSPAAAPDRGGDGPCVAGASAPREQVGWESSRSTGDTGIVGQQPLGQAPPYRLLCSFFCDLANLIVSL